MRLASANACPVSPGSSATNVLLVSGTTVLRDASVSESLIDLFNPSNWILNEVIIKILACGCNTEYSHGFGCNAKTGHCECLPGVVGDKCDRCPYRNVLVPEEGCLDCDSCTHDLLNSTDALELLIDPIMIEFEVGNFFNF